MIEITESKASEMAEHAEKMLKYGKKLYECIEGLAEESSMGERGGYSNRGGGGYGNRYGNRGGSNGSGYGNRMGYRNEDDWDDDDPYMGERRGVPGSGRGLYRR